MVGPSKHSAKQKAFVTVLAWSVFLLPRPGKAPGSSGGLFQALKKAGGEGMGGALFIPLSILSLATAIKGLTRGPLIEGRQTVTGGKPQSGAAPGRETID